MSRPSCPDCMSVAISLCSCAPQLKRTYSSLYSPKGVPSCSSSSSGSGRLAVAAIERRPERSPELEIGQGPSPDESPELAPEIEPELAEEIAPSGWHVEPVGHGTQLKPKGSA